MDTIRIRNLKFNAFLGVFDWEQQAPRPVSVTAELRTDLKKAGESDNLADTVDYAALSRKIIGKCGTKQATPKRYALIERMAEDIASIALDFDKRITSVRIIVSKPGAVPEADNIEVEIERTRE